MFYLIHYIQNLMSVYSQYKIVNEILYFFSYQIFKITVHFTLNTKSNSEKSHF